MTNNATVTEIETFDALTALEAMDNMIDCGMGVDEALAGALKTKAAVEATEDTRSTAAFCAAVRAHCDAVAVRHNIRL